VNAADLLLIRSALERDYREARQKAQDRTRPDSDRQYYFRRANHARALLDSLESEFSAGAWERSA
jgi:hypothetical protein